MDNINKIKVAVQRCSSGNCRKVAFLLLIVSMNCSVGLGDDANIMTSDQRQTEAAESKMPIIDAAKSLFSLPTASDFWILKVEELFRQGWPYFPPRNLDFRGGSGRDEGVMGKEGATVKVKEAVVKSLDKSKATVEDSAKSAAKFADDGCGGQDCKEAEENLVQQRATESRSRS